MARGFQPAYSADVGDRDLEQVVAVVRSRLPPANGLGMIAAGLDRATAAIAGAFMVAPAVVAPPPVENAAGGLACEPVVVVEGVADGEACQQHAPVRDVAASAIRPVRTRRLGPDIDVREIRGKLKLTQDAFAKTSGFAVATVRDWEQGRKAPEAAARHLLMVIEHRPNVVRDALGRYGVAKAASA